MWNVRCKMWKSCGEKLHVQHQRWVCSFYLHVVNVNQHEHVFLCSLVLNMFPFGRNHVVMSVVVLKVCVCLFSQQNQIPHAYTVIALVSISSGSWFIATVVLTRGHQSFCMYLQWVNHKCQLLSKMEGKGLNWHTLHTPIKNKQPPLHAQILSSQIYHFYILKSRKIQQKKQHYYSHFCITMHVHKYHIWDQI